MARGLGECVWGRGLDSGILGWGAPQALQPPGLSLGPSPSNLHSSPPHSTSSSCKRGALPGDLHRLRQDRHEWRPLEKLRSRGPGAHRRPTGRLWERAEPQPPDSPPKPRLWKGAGGFPSPFAGEGCQLAGCALGAPQPPPASPTTYNFGVGSIGSLGTMQPETKSSSLLISKNPE